MRGRLEGELELEGVILAVGLGSGWIFGGCGGALGWCVGFLGLKGAWWRLGGGGLKPWTTFLGLDW